MAVVRTRAWGELEASVMRILWAAESPLSAKEVQGEFGDPIPAYTTVMTALDRLEKKGRVVRSGDSPRKVRFEAAQAEDEHAGETMMSVLEHTTDRQAALLRFAGRLDDDDMALLQRAITGKRSRSSAGMTGGARAFEPAKSVERTDAAEQTEFAGE